MSTPRLGWIKSSASGSSSNKRGGGGASSASSSKAASLFTTLPNRPATAYKDDKNRVAEYQTPEDQCPICKSDRYLNPKLRLLVSSECYHKMCESCIERLFTLGPAPCPTCETILRKSGFKIQTFEDLRVEEEVAVRRRIAKAFNKRRDDFVDNRSYDDYLEEVEDITFNLLNKIDLPGTEARIRAFTEANASAISSNALLEEEDRERIEAEEAQEREEREWRREQGRKGVEEEEKEKERLKKEVLEKLEHSSASASQIMSSIQSAAKTSVPNPPTFTSLHPSRLRKAKGGRKSPPPGPPPPYKDPYDSYDSLFVLLPEYDDPATRPLRDDPTGVFAAGGFKVPDVWERTIRSAVAGLAVPVLRDELDEGSMSIDG